MVVLFFFLLSEFDIWKKFKIRNIGYIITPPMNAKWRNETNLGHGITICSPTPFVNPGARKSSKENETSSSGLYLSRYGLATEVSRKAALCAAATQCKILFRKNSNVFPSIKSPWWNRLCYLCPNDKKNHQTMYLVVYCVWFNEIITYAIWRIFYALLFQREK